MKCGFLEMIIFDPRVKHGFRNVILPVLYQKRRGTERNRFLTSGSKALPQRKKYIPSMTLHLALLKLSMSCTQSKHVGL